MQGAHLKQAKTGSSFMDGFAGKKTPPKDNFSSEALYENKIKTGPVAGAGGR
jgi:hypothetical protein